MFELKAKVINKHNSNMSSVHECAKQEKMNGPDGICMLEQTDTRFFTVYFLFRNLSDFIDFNYPVCQITPKFEGFWSEQKHTRILMGNTHYTIII